MTSLVVSYFKDVSTLFAIDIHQIMLILLFLTPFDHFHFHRAAGPVPKLILAPSVANPAWLRFTAKNGGMEISRRIDFSHGKWSTTRGTNAKLLTLQRLRQIKGIKGCENKCIYWKLMYSSNAFFEAHRPSGPM